MDALVVKLYILSLVQNCSNFILTCDVSLWLKISNSHVMEAVDSLMWAFPRVLTAERVLVEGALVVTNHGKNFLAFNLHDVIPTEGISVSVLYQVCPFHELIDYAASRKWIEILPKFESFVAFPGPNINYYDSLYANMLMFVNQHCISRLFVQQFLAENMLARGEPQSVYKIYRGPNFPKSNENSLFSMLRD